MINVCSSEFNQERAMKDITYCELNANTKSSLDDSGKFFIENPHFYLNSSDNVKRTVETTLCEDSVVLTVGASGDYMLDSILYGAREVVNFDINSIQYYVVCLKVWAIQTLDYSEFIEFFTDFRSSLFLNHKIFEKIIAPFENEAAYPFWKRFARLRRIEDVASRNIINEMGFMLRRMLPYEVPDNELIFAINSSVGPKIMPEKFKGIRLINVPGADKECFGYISSEENYNKVRERINDVKLSFIVSSIEDIRDKIDENKKFDMIYVSNIPFYLGKDNIVSTVINQLIPLLCDNGAISCYHQGMRINWFKNKLSNRKFKIQKGFFNTKDPLYMITIRNMNEVISANAVIESNPNIIVEMEEIPTYGGTNSTNVDTDVLMLIKKR